MGREGRVEPAVGTVIIGVGIFGCNAVDGPNNKIVSLSVSRMLGKSCGGADACDVLLTTALSRTWRGEMNAMHLDGYI